MEKGSPVQAEIQWICLPGYVFIALLIFFFSVCLTTSNHADYFHKLIQSVKTQSATGQRQAALLASITAFHEEIVWRMFFQSVISDSLGTFLAVIVVAIAFTFWHRQQLMGSAVRTLELLLFSLILGIAFVLSGDPLLVIVIHMLRNYFILVGNYGEKI